jgi:hypothetical protein
VCRGLPRCDVQAFRLSFSKKLENLTACVALYVAHYNIVYIHGSLNMTPAMKAKIAGHPCPMEELVETCE